MPIIFHMSGYLEIIFCLPIYQKSVSYDKKIVLSLTDFENSNCFAALIIDIFIKALQSKDFSEILLICVNFLVIVHGSSDFSGKIDILFSGHKKYYGRISILGMGSLRSFYIKRSFPEPRLIAKLLRHRHIGIDRHPACHQKISCDRRIRPGRQCALSVVCKINPSCRQTDRCIRQKKTKYRHSPAEFLVRHRLPILKRRILDRI